MPVICGDRCGLRHWLTPDDGLLPVATDDAATFGRLAANQLADRDRLEDVGRRGAASVRRLFDPAVAVRRQLDLLAQVRADRLVGGLGSAVGLGTGHRSRRALRPSPKLGVVVLAHNALGYTKRCIASLRHHTTVPLRLVVVDNASTDGTADWLRGLDDDRVRPVLLPENRGVPGGRNVGLDHLDGDEDWIVFLDNDTEVLADWWAPYVAALDADPDAGIAGEDGVRVTWGPDGRELHPVVGDGPQPCDVAVGFCLFLRPETVARIGRFDESLGLFWHDDDDYAMRAARIGERVLRLRAGKVLHFEHRSSATVAGIWDGPSTPAAMSADNQRYVATKVARQRPTPTSRFLVLAHADEVLGDPALLATYGQAFTAADDASLVVYGPSVDPIEFERGAARRRRSGRRRRRARSPGRRHPAAHRRRGHRPRGRRPGLRRPLRSPPAGAVRPPRRRPPRRPRRPAPARRPGLAGPPGPTRPGRPGTPGHARWCKVLSSPSEESGDSSHDWVVP